MTGPGTQDTIGAVTADDSRPGSPPDRTVSEPPRPGSPRAARVARRTTGRRWPALGVAFVGYLTLSVVEWWQVWSTHPTGVTTCGCGDASLFTWFLAWPAYALAHGHDPFYSTAIFHPAGIDLLSNTSVLAIGIPLAPVTWLFGPVATLNVASTLAPALSALAMFWLLRRWVRWIPAAFVGGLLYGFSPFAFVNVAGGHLMTAVLVLVPLIVGSLDDILVRQRRPPLAAGIVLGVLAAAEFFISSEVLVILLMCAVVGVVLLALYGAIWRSEELRARLPHALRALGVGAGVTLILLVYPLWVTLAGPAHLSGLVWPTLHPGDGAIILSNVWHLRVMTALRSLMVVAGGYEGPSLPQGEYLGVSLLVIMAAGLLIWWRDRRLWFFAALGAVSVALAVRGPWGFLGHIPLVQNIIPGRFYVVTTLCAAVILAVVVEGVYRWVGRLGAGRVWAVLGRVAALGVATVALVPIGSALAPNVPLTAEPVAVPRWFTEVAPHLPSHQVVLTIPAPFTLIQAALTWQAVDSLHFALVGGSGPEGLPLRAGPERAGLEVVSAASFDLTGPPAPTAAHIDAVRQALAGWGVTIVVMPDPSLPPRYDRGTSPASALGLFTVAIGRRPQYQAGAWVWSAVKELGPRLSISASNFERCTTDLTLAGRAHLAVPDCVAGSSQPAP
jgi:hypothetical protein